MATASHRADRVGHLVRSALSTVLMHETHDKNLQNTTITEVQMSKDLRVAKIYYISQTADKLLKASLDGAIPKLKKRLAQGVNLRYVPELKFFRDTHNEEVERIYKLLDEVHAKPVDSNEV